MVTWFLWSFYPSQSQPRHLCNDVWQRTQLWRPCALYCVSYVSQRIAIFRLVKRLFVDTSVLLRCCFAFLLKILKGCSRVCGSAAECHLLLLERQVYSVARLCPDQSLMLLCHRRNVSGLSMFYMINSNSNHSVVSKLPSASTRVWHPLVQAASHPLKFEVWRRRTSQFARCFLPAQVQCGITFPSLCLIPERWMGSTVQSTDCCFPELCFFSVFRDGGVCGVAKGTYKQLCFPHLGLCCWF